MFKNTKKLFFPLIILLVLSLTASCGTSDRNTNKDGKLSVITTVFPLYDFALQIGGNKVDAEMLLTPGAEVHGFEPTASDMLKVNKADLFIYIGGESEKWVDSVIRSTASGSYKALKTIDRVALHHQEHSHEDGEEHTTDEHIWTSLTNASLIAEAIAKAFVEVDEENAEFYRANLEKLTSDIKALDNEYREMINQAKTKTLVFAERFPFIYLAEDYGLTYYAAFDGCSHDSEPTLKRTAFLIDMIKKNSLNSVFVIEYSDRSIAEAIREATSAEILMLHSCHNVSTDELKSGVSYCSLMRNNLTVLKKALGVNQ